jgi:hypothetical protein
MKEELILAASVAVIALLLYGVWLVMPENFLYALTGYIAVLAFGISLALAGATSQEEKHVERR